MKREKIDDRVIAAFITQFLIYFGPIFIISFASSYMTDVLDYSAFRVSTVLLLGRGFDVLISTLSGPILQRFNPSRGRRDRLASWADVIGILSFVTLLMTFADSTILGKGGVWVTGLWFALYSGANDLVTGIIFSMMGKMTETDLELRNKIGISMSRAGKFAGVVGGFLTLPMVQICSQIVPGHGYFLAAGIFGFMMMLGLYIFRRIYDRYVVFGTKECLSETGQDMEITEICKSLFKNDALRAIVLADIFYYSGAYICNFLTVYYFKLMGEFGTSYSLIQGLISVAGVIGAVVMPMLGLKLGKKKSKSVWFLWYSIFTIIFAFAGGRSVWIFLFVQASSQLLFTMWFFYQGPYLMDASEYYLYKTGVDTRIAAPAMAQVANDIGGAIGGALAGYGIALIGYDAIDIETLSNLTPEFMRKFLMLFGIGGIILLIGAVIWMKLYKITDKEAAFYAEENAKKKF